MNQHIYQKTEVSFMNNGNIFKTYISTQNNSNSLLKGIIAALVIILSAVIPLKSQTGLNVSSIDGGNGVSIFGGESEAGHSIATGDLNGDGIDDLFVGDIGDDSDDIHGRVFVVFGHDTASADFLYSLGEHDENGLFSFSSLDGDNGLVVNGSKSFDMVGNALSAGDVNNDGFDDLIIGAVGDHYQQNGNTYETGRVYIILGASDIGSSNFGSIELNSLSQSDGYILNGVPDQFGNASTGTAVQTGDFYNDGHADILIGDPASEARSGVETGGAYMIYGDQLSSVDGADGSTDGSIYLSNLNGTTGYYVGGIDNNDQTGRDVGAGDINNDGHSDLIIGAPRADALADTSSTASDGNGGQANVLFGDEIANLDSDDGSTDGTIDLDILASPRGFKVNPIDYSDELGDGITTGDINDDGITDLIIGAADAYDQTVEPEQSFVGEIYAIFGSSTIGSSGSLSMTNFDGFTFQGIDDDDLLGRSVSTGDVNGDQVDDIIVGALGVSSFTYLGGETYVLFGGDSIVSDGFMTADELDGSNGFSIKGEYYSGNSGKVVGVADLNNDGIDEVIFGAPDAGFNGDGYTYVFNNARTTAIKESEGFRTLSAPASGTIFNEMLAPMWTQGITNSDSPNNGSANVWKWDKNSGSNGDWVPLNNQQSSTLSSAEGFLFYAYSDDDADGQNEGFPKHITTLEYDGEGSLNSGSINPVSNLGDGVFEFIGNPYSKTIDWDNVSNSGLSSTIYVYDNSAGSWIMWNGTSGDLTNGLVAPFQGFFVQGNGGSGSVTIEEDDISGATSLEKSVNKEKNDPAVKLNLKNGTYSNSAWIQISEQAEAGRDQLDGVELKPLDKPAIQLYTKDSSGKPLNINAYPAKERIDLTLSMISLGIQDSSNMEAELSLDTLKHFEGEVSVFLRDHHKSSTVELTQNSSARVELTHQSVSSEKAAKNSSKPGLPLPEMTNDDENGSRYSIIIESDISTPINDTRILLEDVTLHQNYPNPFNPETKIQFDVPEQQTVKLTVFNAIGQKVSTLIDQRKAAGTYSVVFDAESLPSGIYIYRLQVGSNVQTKKMTLIK